MVLYRIEARVFDHLNQRIVKEVGPWHPDKSYVESFAKTLYNGMQITMTMIDARTPKKVKEIPVVLDAVDDLNAFLAGCTV